MSENRLEYPDDTTGCGITLVGLGLFFGGLGLLVFGLLLAGISAGPGTPDPLLIGAGLAASAVGVALILLARRAGGACPKCGRWAARELLGREDASRRSARFFRCKSCDYRWREGMPRAGSPCLHAENE
jgi:predicted RNA-binding Zn-ribbon protein involved in translation (DUF1610 family)